MFFKDSEKSVSLVSRTVLTGMVLVLAGCSSTKSELEYSSTEPILSSVQQETAAAQVLMDAKRYYQHGLMTLAQDQFSAILDTYPLSPYVEFARIKIADSMFYKGNYESAAAAYQELLESFPSSPSRPYILLMAGKSYSMHCKGPDHDVSPLERSLELHGELLERYPYSPYAPVAKHWRVNALNTLSEHEKIVMEFYERQGAKEAQLARHQNLESKLVPRAEAARLLLASANRSPLMSEGSEGAPPVRVLAAARHLPDSGDPPPLSPPSGISTVWLARTQALDQVPGGS